MFPRTGEALRAKIREILELYALSDKLRAESAALIEHANYIKQTNRRLALGSADSSPGRVPPPAEEPAEPPDGPA